MSEPTPPAASPTLLAVDLGLRCGFACFALATAEAPARLRWYRSSHFGTLRQLKAAIRGLLHEAGRPQRLVLEGDRELAHPWQKAALRIGAEVALVSAEHWRPDMLLPREQRAGRDAKKAADARARALIAASGLSAPTSLRHDAAEAICLGAWACGLR